MGLQVSVDFSRKFGLNHSSFPVRGLYCHAVANTALTDNLIDYVREDGSLNADMQTLRSKFCF
jgi:hypothetical protein